MAVNPKPLFDKQGNEVPRAQDSVDADKAPKAVSEKPKATKKAAKK